MVKVWINEDVEFRGKRYFDIPYLPVLKLFGLAYLGVLGIALSLLICPSLFARIWG